MSVLGIDDIEDPAILKAKRGQKKGMITKMERQVASLIVAKLDTINIPITERLIASINTQFSEYESYQTQLIYILENESKPRPAAITREEEELLAISDQASEMLMRAHNRCDLAKALRDANKSVRLVERFVHEITSSMDVTDVTMDADLKRAEEKLENAERALSELPNAEAEPLIEQLKTVRLRFQGARTAREHAKPPLDPSASTPIISSHGISPLDLLRRSRLPDLTFPKFSGEKKDWPLFWSEFTQLISKDKLITPQDKMTYLRRAVTTPQALNEYRHLTGKADDFEHVSDFLIERYHDPQLLYRDAVESLISGKNIDEADARDWALTMESSARYIEQSGHVKADDVLATLGELKLTGSLSKQWTKVITKTNKPPTFRDLTTFLHDQGKQYNKNQDAKQRTRTTSRQTAEPVQQKPKRQPAYVSQSAPAPLTTTAPVFTPQAQRARAPCQLCKVERHAMATCPTFMSNSVAQRMEVVRKLKLCPNCLGYHHTLETCRSSRTCRECSQRHHSMLHGAVAAPPSTTPAATTPGATPTDPQPAYLANADCDVGILPTAIVTIEANGSTVQARAILDVCSTATYVTSRLVQRLGAVTTSKPISTNTVGNIPGLQCELVAHLTIRPRRQHLSQAIHLDAHVSQSVCMVLPTDPLPDAASLPFLEGLDLADPSFHLPGRVDILLGSEATARMSLVGQTEARASADGRYLAADSIYGWIIQGGSTPQQAAVYLSDKAQFNPATFWETEEVQPHQQSLTKDESEAVTHYSENHSRDSEGRYVVSLPKRQPTPELGHSRTQAERRFEQNRKALMKKGEWEPFKAAVAEYGHLGHAEPCPVVDLLKPDNQSFYLPMHGVVKASSTSTKLRVVFDASARSSNGMSLNDTLLTGPNLYPLTTEIILKFRRHNVGMTADISKMFREISLSPQDRDLHRYVWRDQHDQPQIWRMKRVTFGVASSPFLATQTLLQLAADHEQQHPEAAEVIRNEFYVDDCVTGASTVLEAITKRQQLTDLLNKGQMSLRKWRSSSAELQLSIPDDLCETENDNEISLLTPDRCHKTLGIHWDTKSDSMFVSTPTLDIDRTATKRQVSSDLARTYDVMGWFAPAMVIAKLLLQSIWVQGLDWDEPVPGDITERWRQWTEELPLITQHAIPRCYFRPFRERLSVQLHGFSDASEKAYGGVIYLRTTYTDSSATTIALVTSKTKVSPTTPITIPKLELSGAVLLSKLMENTRKTLELSSESLYAWTDSTIVLAWLNQEPGKLKVFVSNRVSSIITRVPASRWRHVPTEDNPADAASRGLMPQELIDHHLWWKGPSWLGNDPSTWPTRTNERSIKILEIKKEFVALTIQQTITSDLSGRYSSFQKLVRVTAWLNRFISNVRLKEHSLRRFESRLSIGELDDAERILVKGAQRQHFGTELTALQQQKELPPKSSISKLHPIISRDGILTVGGRLEESDLPELTKHPLILPKQSWLTYLIIRQLHITSHHAGASILLNLLAQKYHISGARSLIRKVTNQCIPCRKAYAKRSSQLMGQLPSPRITVSSAFSHVGVDLAGPMALRSGNPRKPRVEKAYICLFVCLATKAIHLEVVSDLTTEAFMATFQRFVGRRGLPTIMYSDNGTNFVGANRCLREAYDQLHSKETADSLNSYLTLNRVTWTHIPELSPHFGGLWEGNIKTAKTLLRSIAGTTSLNYERLTTFLCQAEAVMNSRPLVPLDAQPTDSSLVLTPGHFLVGRPLVAPPDITNVLGLGTQSSRSRWNHCRLLSEHFWRQWTSSYVTTLNKFHKWRYPKRNIRVGDVVLVKDQFLFLNRWPLARVIEVHPGRDGLVRTATVRGPSCGTHKRPIVKLVLILPEEEDDNFSPPEDGRASDGTDVQEEKT